MPRVFQMIIVAGCMISSTACVSSSGLSSAGSLPKPSTRDYEDGSDDSGEEWDFVGREGRAGQERERDPDPWFRDWFMSEKAKSIERNLGID